MAARIRDAVELVRPVAVLVLLDKGYDLEQVKGKLATMIDNRADT